MSLLESTLLTTELITNMIGSFGLIESKIQSFLD